MVYCDYGFDLERLTGRSRKADEPFTFAYIGTHKVGSWEAGKLEPKKGDPSHGNSLLTMRYWLCGYAIVFVVAR